MLAEAEEARQLALATKNPSAAVTATKEKGVLSGQRVEPSEQGQPGEFADLEKMSADELRHFLLRMQRGCLRSTILATRRTNLWLSGHANATRIGLQRTSRQRVFSRSTLHAFRLLPSSS